MNFDIKTIWVWNIFGFDVHITETILNTWIIMAVLIAFAVFVRIKFNKFKEIPHGLQNVVEVLVDTFEGLLKSSAGDGVAYFGSWFFMTFIFIFFSNISGLFGLRPPTADWATTFAFAFATLMLIQAAGLMSKKGKYLKEFISPSPLFLPLNIIGELARPISLSFRLFGNILSGVILMGLVYGIAPIFVRFLLPAALHAYFDLISGALQTYIFCVLSMTFVGTAANE